MWSSALRVFILSVLSASALQEAQELGEYACNFEKDACEWTEDTDNYLMRWVRKGAGNPMQGTGPIADGSGDRTGHFMNVHVIQAAKTAAVTLTSPRLRSQRESSSCSLTIHYSLFIPNPYHCQNEMGDSDCLEFADTKELQEEFCRDEPDFCAENCAKMCGMKCGHLSVFVSNSLSDKGTRVYHLDYSNDETWSTMKIAIPASITRDAFWVTIQAETGWDLNSYIAVDNVAFFGCEFSKPIKLASSAAQSTTPLTTTHPFTTPTPSTMGGLALADQYNCDFETSLCGWKSEKTVFQWNRNYMGSPINGTGPEKDGSGEKHGYYAVMAVDRQQAASPTRLVSPKMDLFAPSSCNLTFHYSSYAPSSFHCSNKDKDHCSTVDSEEEACHKYEVWFRQNCARSCGFNCAKLKVFITNDLDQQGKPAFFLKSPKDNVWYLQSLDIGIYTMKPFWVIFEGTNGLDTPAYIAVDNIKFEGCELKIKPSTVTTTNMYVTRTINMYVTRTTNMYVTRTTTTSTESAQRFSDATVSSSLAPTTTGSAEHATTGSIEHTTTDSTEYALTAERSSSLFTGSFEQLTSIPSMTSVKDKSTTFAHQSMVFEETRTQFSKSSASPEQSSGSKQSLTPLILGIIGGLIAVAAVVSGVLLYVRAKKMNALRRVGQEPIRDSRKTDTESSAAQPYAHQAWLKPNA